MIVLAIFAFLILMQIAMGADDLDNLSKTAEKNSDEAISGVTMNLPLNFIENKGQVSQEVKYMTKTPKETVYFSLSGAKFVISSGNNSSPQHRL